MPRKKQYKAIITDESYMEDLIWMSYRYCIGRHTIATCAHADDIAKYSFDHISENRKSFIAHDIRQEINDTLRWRNNIECHDYRDRLDKDALSIIIERLYEKYGPQLPSEDIWTKYKYTIEDGVLNIEEYDGKVDHEHISTILHDLLPWIKLANALDEKCHRVITTVYEGKKEEHECFPYPSIDFQGMQIDVRWVDINSYRTNPGMGRYIDPQYITEISQPYE